MMVWSTAESENARQLIALALQEDLGMDGDRTCQAVISEDLQGQAQFVARSAGVVSGLPLIAMVYEQISAGMTITMEVSDGSSIASMQVLATVKGSMQSLLSGERTALNFLQRLSGIATLTNQYVQATTGTSAKILDTRKTTPGWRVLEKYAVRCGGGTNHRMGLYDGILIKDNHLACLGDKSIANAVRAARKSTANTLPVEIEVDNLQQFADALKEQPDIILLDNMSLDDMRSAVEQRNASGLSVLLEASGGLTLARIPDVAKTGVDRISVGALTHSAPALDIGLDYESH